MCKQHAPSNHVEQPSEGSDTAPAASVEHWRDRHPPVRPGVVALALAVDGEQAAATWTHVMSEWVFKYSLNMY